MYIWPTDCQPIFFQPSFYNGLSSRFVHFTCPACFSDTQTELNCYFKGFQCAWVFFNDLALQTLQHMHQKVPERYILSSLSANYIHLQDMIFHYLVHKSWISS
jgi:hypothetical protein